MSIDWERVARAHTHASRLAALKMFDESPVPLSPVQIAKATGKEVGHVGYHVRKLQDLGLVEFVSERPVRGAVEHFFTLVEEA